MQLPITLLDMGTDVTESELNVTLTCVIQLLMHGKKVGSILGKKGGSVKKIMYKSGACIDISEGNCPEGIITLTGPANTIFKAFAMIIDKLEEDSCMTNSTAASRPLVTLRLVVPASQCDFLIGKDGCKIKKYRADRCSSPSHHSPIITEYVKQIHVVMLGFPWEGMTIPYRPKPSGSPIIFGPSLEAYPDLTKLHQSHFLMTHGNTGFSAGLNASAQTISQELTVPNDLIGCIIGHQGAQINEIHQMSGAQIEIVNPVEGSTDRQATITGSAASISLAQYLINVSLALMIHCDPSLLERRTEDTALENQEIRTLAT
uniref:K Homology domain-containing protein n=1 Tax=Spermophilus dauricus TaxID=99837 RepID=A0A8C9QHG1_SPEDA